MLPTIDKMYMKMKAIIRIIPVLMSLSLFAALLTNCGGKSSDETAENRNPVLSHGTPLYDEGTGTFSLEVSADSVEGASLMYSLILGDSVMARNEEGRFSGINPFEEGYDIKLEAQWPDTLIERMCHVMDFVVPTAPVEKISTSDLAALINAKDESLRTGSNEHIAQGVTLNVTGSRMQPQMLPDVLVLIENGVWKSVEVIKLDYNDKNLVTDITLRPVGEKADVIDDEDEDYDY